MQNRFTCFRRGAVFYCEDRSSGQQHSLRTRNRDEARRIVQAKNDSVNQPLLNLVMAKTFLAAHDPKIITRTWADVMERFCNRTNDSTRMRHERVVRTRPMQFLKSKRLIETTADDLFEALKLGSNSTIAFLQTLHNDALGIDTSTVIGLRDRAIIAIMVYSFARVSAVVGMNVKDFYPNGKRFWFRFTEKGGKFHEVPAHHNAEAYLDAYLQAAQIAGEPKAPLFRTAPGKSSVLTAQRLNRKEALAMIKRRAKDAGLPANICNHTFRATGITTFLLNGGTVEKAMSQPFESQRHPSLIRISDNQQRCFQECKRGWRSQSSHL